MMHSKVYLLLYTNLFIHCSNAFNITNMLSPYPSFSTFNHYLSVTDLATEINLHEKITVFAVGNNAMSRLSGKPHDVVKNILKVHVVLGYYDVEKLRTLGKHTGQMTTLFQTTGLAGGQQGFLKASVVKKNIFIGSATRDSAPGALLVRSVASEPCGISVISISTVIVPDGISGANPPVEPPGYTPRVAPPEAYGVPSDAPKLGPAYAKLTPPSLNPPMTSPAESPVDAPEHSRESSLKPINTPARPPPKPAGPPATSGWRDISSNFGSSLYVLLTLLLLSFIYLIV